MRRKRIGDSEWSTYAELDRVPEVNEKCFCLEPKTRKWMRARVTSIEKDKTQFVQLRLMDAGYLLTSSLESLIPWKNFDLSKIPARSIRCVLYNEASADKYEKDISLEAKFMFKDLTTNLYLKCIIVEPLNNKTSVECLPGSQPASHEHATTTETYNDANDEQIWIVKLYRQKEYKEMLDYNNNASSNDAEEAKLVEPQSLNQAIIEFNINEKNNKNENPLNKEMRCVDIRLASGNIESKITFIKTALDTKNATNALGTLVLFFHSIHFEI